MTEFVEATKLAEGFNCLLPERYHVTPDLITAKTTGSKFFWPELSEVNGDAWVCVKHAGPWTPEQETTAHISAFGGSSGESVAMLLRDVLARLGENRICRVTFGAEPDHLFPGCPTDAPDLEMILKAAGFSFTGEAHDVEFDLAEYEIPEGVSFEGLDIRRATEADSGALQDFFTRTFPGRWKHDVLRRHADHPGDIALLFHDKQVEGFALTQSASSGQTPVAGANWHLDLGENWAALGPIGISEPVRGRGWGHALLAWSLNDLKAQGSRRTIIDWTSLLDFYGRHGFVKARSYRYASKTLTR